MEWKSIEGYEGYYDVSSCGMVRSNERRVQISSGKTRLVKEKLLRARINNCGYYYIRLSKNGITKSFFVHRLVAQAFLPNPLNLPQVNHLKSKSDNCHTDLEWADASQNTTHSYLSGKNKHHGENHFMAVGVVDTELGLTFPTIKEWCNARNIVYSTGRNILSGCNRTISLETSRVYKVKLK